MLREKVGIFVANKLNGNILKVGEIQEEIFVNSGGDEGENNDQVGNWRVATTNTITIFIRHEAILR